jgi:hypothetical protein
MSSGEDLDGKAFGCFEIEGPGTVHAGRGVDFVLSARTAIDFVPLFVCVLPESVYSCIPWFQFKHARLVPVLRAVLFLLNF